MPLKRPPFPRAKTTPPPNTTVYIGVDSNKRPIKTAYAGVGGGLTSTQPPSSRRYPNYIPELRTQRVETGKQSFQDKLKERMKTQRQAEETALNRLVMEKAQRISSMVPQIQAPQYPRKPRPLIQSQPEVIKKTPFQVQSLFRASPEAFSDSGSRVLQMELARRHLGTTGARTSVPLTPASSDTASDMSEYFIRRRTRHS